jgi:hypothetical protein
MDFSSFPRALLEGLQMELEAELFARDEEKLSEQVLIEILA